MDVGICIPHYGKPIEIVRILDIAKRAETLGFDSVWVTDHLIVPASMNIIYRDHMLEPIALLSHLAAVVRRVRLGTSVSSCPTVAQSCWPKCWPRSINSHKAG